MENLNKAMIIRNGNVIGAIGDKHFSNAPIGVIQAYSGNSAPWGYFLCDGASYKVKDYPDLYAVIGNTYGGDETNFNVPDYRETVLVGIGGNTTDTIASHDVYELGEFKDDQFQGHWHNLGNSSGIKTVALGASMVGGDIHSAEYDSSENRYMLDTALDAISDGTNGTPRVGTTTHGKQKGVTYIIKAFHTNEGTDEGVSDSVINYVDGKIDDTSTGDTQTTWSSSKIASEINPTIDQSKVFSDGELNIDTLYNTYGEGRYVIIGQGSVSNASATIDVQVLVGGTICYTAQAIYAGKTSATIFSAYTHQNPTINFDTNYLNACNHIAKVCSF